MLILKYVGDSIKKFSYRLLGLCACLLLGILTNCVEESLIRPDYEETVGEKE